MAGTPSGFRQPTQTGDVEGASAVKRGMGTHENAIPGGNAMCALISSRLARNEGDQAAALGADARGSALARSK